MRARLGLQGVCWFGLLAGSSASTSRRGRALLEEYRSSQANCQYGTADGVLVTLNIEDSSTAGVLRKARQFLAQLGLSQPRPEAVNATLDIIQLFTLAPIVLLRADDASLERIAHAQLEPEIVAIEANCLVELNAGELEGTQAEEEMSTAALQYTPPYNLWALDRLDRAGQQRDGKYVYSSGTSTATGSGAVVYILDTGILASHQDLGNRATGGFVASLDARWSPNGIIASASSCKPGCSLGCNSHGTTCASLAGGTLYGVAKEVGLVSVQIFDCSGKGSVGNIIRGMDWAVAARENGEARASAKQHWRPATRMRARTAPQVVAFPEGAVSR